MSDIYRYISNNYHAFSMKSRGKCLVSYETLYKELCSIIFDLFKARQFVVSDIPKLIFINTAERKSKYIVTNDEHYILLDLHQVMECAWGSLVATCIDGDILTVVNAGSGSLFLYSSNENILKAKICNCYNLADLCFSTGYVDAAIKNLCSIIMIHEDINSNNLVDLIFQEEFLCEAKIIGEFIYLHELTHYFIEQNQKSISGTKKFEKLINLIRLKYESGVLSKEWRKYAYKYSSDNHIMNDEIANIFSTLKINEKYPGLFELLQENILSWKNMTFDSNDWGLYSEELICDIIALNAIIDNEKKDYNIISYIVRALLIQETFSLQESLLTYITGKKKEIYSRNIKRVQLIFTALLVDYQEFENQQGWDSIISNLNYNKEEFDDLLINICNSVEVIHENFYLIAVHDFCKSLLSEDILHKHINCAYFLDSDYKKFVFTDDYSDKKNNNKIHLTNIDGVLLQKGLTEEYDKFVQYVFQKN